jgi:hypothetical protein
MYAPGPRPDQRVLEDASIALAGTLPSSVLAVALSILSGISLGLTAALEASLGPEARADSESMAKTAETMMRGDFEGRGADPKSKNFTALLPFERTRRQAEVLRDASERWRLFYKSL